MHHNFAMNCFPLSQHIELKFEVYYVVYVTFRDLYFVLYHSQTFLHMLVRTLELHLHKLSQNVMWHRRTL